MQVYSCYYKEIFIPVEIPTQFNQLKEIAVIWNISTRVEI